MVSDWSPEKSKETVNKFIQNPYYTTPSPIGGTGGGTVGPTQPSQPTTPSKTIIAPVKTGQQPVVTRESTFKTGQSYIEGLKSDIGFLAMMNPARLGEKSPGETAMNIARGAAFITAYSLPHQEFVDITQIKTPKTEAYALGQATPFIALAGAGLYAATRQPKVSYKMSDIQVKSTGEKEIFIGKGATMKGQSFEAVGGGKIVFRQPISGRISEQQTSFGADYGLIPLKEGKYAVIGGGKAETYTEKGMIQSPFISKGVAYERPTETISFMKSYIPGKQVYSIGTAKEIMPSEYGYLGMSTADLNTAFATGARIKVISPEFEKPMVYGGGFVKPGKGAISLEILKAETQLISKVGLKSGVTAGGQIASASQMIVPQSPIPFVSVGALSLQQNQIKGQQGMFQGLRFDIKDMQKFAQSVKLIQPQPSISATKQVQSASQAQPSISGGMIGQISPSMPSQKEIIAEIPKLRQAMPQQMITPVPTMPYTLPSVILSPYNLGFGKMKGAKSIFGKQPTKYQPSFRALTLGIKSMKIPKFSFTGIGTRPIITRFKRKKRKK